MSQLKVNAIRHTGASSDAITLAADGKATYAATSGTSNFTISDGNLVIGTAGHGIDFAATGGPTGTGSSGTSELLADYEEGTWDPAAAHGSFSYELGKYTKIGRMVFATYEVTFAATSGSSHQNISGLPYAAAQDSGVAQGYHNNGVSFITHLAGSSIWFYAEGGAAMTESNCAGKNYRGTAVYYVA